MENEEPRRNGDAPAPSVIRFGPYELNLRSAELLKNDLRIRLQDQPFQVLIALLERPGEVVLREEIRKRLWPDDTVVEFDHGINAAVKRLRDVLCESAEKPRYIETLARRGYRFIGNVEAEEQIQKEPDTPTVEPSNGEPSLESDIAESGTNGPFSLEQAQCKTPLQPTRILGRSLPAAVVLLVVAGVWVYHRRAPARWAREVALPEAKRLLNAGDNSEAFPFLYRALQILPEDAELMKLRREVSYARLINTNPPGANVQVKSYGAPDRDWLSIGQSPIRDFLLPVGYFRWRITKPGFQTLEAAASVLSVSIEFKLYPEHGAPPEMVHVPSGLAPVFGLRPRLDDYLIDKYEVTNRQFKEFIDHGGYQDQRYWHQEFVKDGRVLSWGEAMGHFRDATGRAGPSTWEVGNYPTGRGEFPVTGVSWYEAHAYAEFAQKQLPSIYHWYRAADQGVHSDILKFSNFGGTGPVQVGSRPSLGAFGTYDIAGNVKEWCSNATGQRRYILGGSWNEGRSYFVVPDALPPFNRSSENGFRCIRSTGGPIPDELNRPVDKPKRDYRTESPASDEMFRVLLRFYAYDETELNAKRESVDDSSPYWRVEKVTFDAAYDRQRVIAFLYLPKNAKPPYQTVLFCPSGHGRVLSNIDEAEMNVFDFLMRSGRAVLFPVTQGMYARRHTIPHGPNGERDLFIQQSKDVRRSLDYLVTRTDILPDRIGLFGMSGGSRIAVITLAQETRIRAAILAQGGFSAVSTPPETDGINFAPRIRIPVLMLNGRYDFVFPVETGQLPMLGFLGSPDKDKRNVLFDTGHAGATKPLIKETLDWLDLYLGPAGK